MSALTETPITKARAVALLEAIAYAETVTCNGVPVEATAYPGAGMTDRALYLSWPWTAPDGAIVSHAWTLAGIMAGRLEGRRLDSLVLPDGSGGWMRLGIFARASFSAIYRRQ